MLDIHKKKYCNRNEEMPLMYFMVNWTQLKKEITELEDVLVETAKTKKRDKKD